MDENQKNIRDMLVADELSQWTQEKIEKEYTKMLMGVRTSYSSEIRALLLQIQQLTGCDNLGHDYTIHTQLAERCSSECLENVAADAERELEALLAKPAPTTGHN